MNIDANQLKEERKTYKKTTKKIEPGITRVNIIKTKDNKIMVDIKALEMLVADKLICLYNNPKEDLCNKTLIAVKETLSDISETAIERIEEQNAAGTKYQADTIKEIELDTSKLFKY